MNVIDDRKVIEKQAYDIVVVGGGVAGIAAAVAAARQNVKVLLLEKNCILGGLATAGLISYYEPLCDCNGTQVVYGIAEELIKLSIQDGYDNLSDDWKNKTGEHRAAYATYFSPTVFSMVLDEYVLKNGVDIRFDSRAVFPVMENGSCKGVIVESTAGKEFYPTKTIIDATGDAQIADRAGIPTETGTNYLLGMGHWTNKELAKNWVDGGKLFKFRQWLYAVNETYKGPKIYKGTTSEEITEFMLKGRAGILARIRNMPNEDREVMALPTMPQYRTIRRIVGKQIFNATVGEKYKDSIGNCANWSSKDHEHYDLPYGILYHPSVGNLWAAGRIVSTDEGRGWEVTRIIPVCALTGQAAGTAAALCVKENYTADTLPIEILQEKLREGGVVID